MNWKWNPRQSDSIVCSSSYCAKLLHTHLEICLVTAEVRQSRCVFCGEVENVGKLLTRNKFPEGSLDRVEEVVSRGKENRLIQRSIRKVWGSLWRQ